MRYLILIDTFQDNTMLKARWHIQSGMHVCLILFPGMNTILTQGYAKLCNVTLTYFPTQDEKTIHVIENSELTLDKNYMFLILVNTCLCRVNLDLHNADMSFFWKTFNSIHCYAQWYSSTSKIAPILFMFILHNVV